MKHFLSLLIIGVVTVVAANLAITQSTHAQTAGEFSIQVTPSPLVTTVKPGQQTDLELKIRNNGLAPEDLKIAARSFSVDDTTGEIKVDDITPPDINNWVRFSAPNFIVQPGQWYTQTITLDLPKETGFSYYFALVISQRNPPPAADGGRLLKGSVAVFTLVNVDRPGATRKLDVVELEASKQLYEYLPAELSVRFKNTGNSIVQPYGNIFIQRSSNETAPLATLAVNESKGYILPGSTRTLKTEWVSGFPRFEKAEDGSVREVWDWTKVSEFRFGQYTAKLVGVYNDGERDVPLEAEVTFWVVPWKIILGIVIIAGLIGLGIWSIIRKVFRVASHKKHHKMLR